MDTFSEEYWRRFGSREVVTVNEVKGHCSKMISLFVFTGRGKCRIAIEFDVLDKQECTKNYFKGESTVSSFVTVQCCCAHPKLIGFVLIRECESVSQALSSITTHSDLPPHRVWYDIACNTVDSAITRVPWLLRHTMFVVDRFHFTGHITSNLFNGDMHRFLDEDTSVAAEIINAIIDKDTSHITYLKGTM